MLADFNWLTFQWGIVLRWLAENYAYILIPFISGGVGWFTNVIALKMTFFPLEYRGIGPFGWQGIIPSRAPQMASLSVDLMTSKLIDIREVFDNVDPHEVSQILHTALKRLTKQLIDEIVDAQSPIPQLWFRLPESSRQPVYERAMQPMPQLMEELIAEFKTEIYELLDLKALAIDTLADDKKLINKIFLEVGKKEFIFIENSGFLFGFIFGVPQMFLAYTFNPWWMLPLAGVIVGYLTNYLALFLIFNPIRERRFLWLRFQGLFVQRKHEVSKKYAEIIAQNILTIDALFDYLLRGPRPQRVRAIVKHKIDSAIDAFVGSHALLVAKTLGIHKIETIKNIVHYRLMEELPVAIRDAFAYTETQLDIEHVIAIKMQQLSDLEFVDFLRPVFQEDEWKLVLIGGILGGLAGLIQYFLFF
ncbi:MAG: hypothetical protein RIS47_772 [Bacteroidota bacterium]|jgi:uncharacterized membrane protein YheB (UPF0754 family)